MRYWFDWAWSVLRWCQAHAASGGIICTPLGFAEVRRGEGVAVLHCNGDWREVELGRWEGRFLPEASADAVPLAAHLAEWARGRWEPTAPAE